MNSGKNDHGPVTALDERELDAVVGGNGPQRIADNGEDSNDGPGSLPDIILIEDPDF